MGERSPAGVGGDGTELGISVMGPQKKMDEQKLRGLCGILRMLRCPLEIFYWDVFMMFLKKISK